MGAWTLIGATALLLAVAMPAQAQDMRRAQQQYKLCGACHGDNGEGNPARNAPRIGGLPAWYVDAQLQKFKQGLRGYKAGDDTGLQMRPMAMALVSDDDRAAVAAYVASLQPAPPAATVSGDAARGKTLYGTCLACHGPEGKGNEALKAPALSHQADWYIVAQLKKFRAGLRGTHKDDVTGAQMRAMVATLPDDQAINDVVVYIRSLAQ